MRPVSPWCVLVDVAIADDEESGEVVDAAVDAGAVEEVVEKLLVEQAAEEDEMVDVGSVDVEVLDAVEESSSLKIEFPNTIACEMSSLVASAVCRGLKAA